MRLTVIGCSGSFPGPDSPGSCYLVEAEGFRLLLDMGNGSLGALQRYCGLHDVDAICLSHLHADHCLDLCSYAVARLYGGSGPQPRIPVYGPAEAADRMTRAYSLQPGPEMRKAFDFRTLTPGTQQIGPFRLTAEHVSHPVETFGIRLEHGQRSLVYSADTGESAALVALARAADLMLCEASFLERPNLPPDLHLTGRQAGQHAARAGVGRLVLTHLVPWNDRSKTLEEATQVFTGPLSLAASGQVYELG
ncbi:MAG TPA: MBL fold metallo-hydrolase [Streptosporangiaceae bacterium]